MTSKTYRYAIIECEGCGSKHGAVGQFAEVAPARADALRSGWALVPKVRANGKAASVTTDPADLKGMKNAGTTGHDVCPACIDTFDPKPLGRVGPTGKPWFCERIERLEAEVKRLSESK